MASLLCAPYSLTTITKPNSRVQLQQKPNSLVSFSSVRSQAREESSKSLLPLFPLRPSRTSTTATKAASANQDHDVQTDVDATVEHIVFIQMKEPLHDTEETLKTALNSLKCLPGVLYLSAGRVGQTYSSPKPFNFFLHSRHTTKLQRDRFMQHPLKSGVFTRYIKDEYKDFTMLDFIHQHREPLDHPQYGYANRYTFLKLKDENNVSSHAEVIQNSFRGSLAKPTSGIIIKPHFTVPDTKADGGEGYNFGIHATFRSEDELAKIGSPEEFGENLAAALPGVLVGKNSVFVADYVVDQVYDGTW